MSASSPIPESVRRDLERMAGPLAERMLSPRVTASATTRNVVAAVNSDGTLDVAMGGAVMQRVPATTACAGVAVGDEVIVTQHGQRLYAMGVLARSLDSTVVVRQVFSERVSFGSVQPNAFAETSVDISDRGCLSAPIVIPVSTGWVEAREATDVTDAGFTAGCFNAGAAAHSAVAEYVCLELA